MFSIKLTALYLLIYGILFLTGWGISEYLCKGKNHQYKFLLTPLIGIIPFSVIPIYFSFLGIKTSTGGWITFILFSLLSLYYFIKDPFTFKKINYHSPLLLLFVIIGVFPTFIIILKAGFLTSTINSYSSLVTYPADYFSHNSVYETVQLDFDKPITNMLFEVLEFNIYCGYFFFIASISSIVSIPIYKLYLALSGIIGSFIPISVFIACKEGFNLPSKLALFISFLVSINVSYFFWPIIGQLPFILGMIYLILILGFIPSMLHCKKRIDHIFYSFLIAGMMSIYPILIPYIVGVAIVFILFQIKYLQKNLSLFKNIATIALFTFLMIPFVFIIFGLRSIDLVSITSSIPQNILRYPYIEELLGFGTHFTMLHDGSLKNYLILLIAMLCVLFICAGLYERFISKNILLPSIFAFIFSLGCYFLAVDLTYHFYKNSIVGGFILISAMVIGGYWIYEKTNSIFVKLPIVMAFIVFIGLNINTYIKISFFSSQPIITKSLIDLEKISTIIPGNNRILVNSRNPTEEAWVSYFLKDNKIKLKGLIEPWGFWILAPFTGKPNTNFFYDYTKNHIDYTLSPKLQYKADIIYTDYGEVAYENDDYILSKNIPNYLPFKGWYNVEKDYTGVFRWTEKESFVLFNRPGKDSILHIDGIVPDVYNKPLEIKIKINENLIDKFYSDSLKINKRYSLSKFPLKESNNVLAFILSKTFSHNEITNSTDSRRLGIRINTINIFDLENLKINRIIDIGNFQFSKFLLTGWSFNEVSADKTNFVWVEGKNASLNIFVDNTEEMEMQFRAYPFSFPGSPLQKVNIYINNKFVSKITLKDKGWAIYRIAIPSTVFKRGLNTIQFTFNYSESPSVAFKNNNDHRKLSAAFDYIKFSNISK